MLKTDAAKLQAERENSGLLESVCIDVAAPLQMENSKSDALGLQEFLQQRADAFDDELFKSAIGMPQDLSELIREEKTLKESTKVPQVSMSILYFNDAKVEVTNLVSPGIPITAESMGVNHDFFSQI